MKNLYEFNSYKEYLQDYIENRAGGGRGMKSRLAQVAGCQPAYVTQVLGGAANLSLEQGEAISRFLNHSEAEKHYFLLLIQWERAGTVGLTAHLRGQIEEEQRSKRHLARRLKEVPSLDEQFRRIYYGRWDYAAIHVLLTVRSCRTPERIASRLRLPLERVVNVLEFLDLCGLATKKGTQYEVGSGRIHLPDDAPEIARHHTNWRLQAIAGVERSRGLPVDEHAHYSSVVTLSKADVKKVRETLLTAIQQSKKVIKESPPEELYGLNLDLFPLT